MWGQRTAVAVVWQSVDQIRYSMKKITLKCRRLLLMFVELTATTTVVSASQFRNKLETVYSSETLPTKALQTIRPFLEDSTNSGNRYNCLKVCDSVVW
jgi:hypothetical protein